MEGLRADRTPRGPREGALSPPLTRLTQRSLLHPSRTLGLCLPLGPEVDAGLAGLPERELLEGAKHRGRREGAPYGPLADTLHRRPRSWLLHSLETQRRDGSLSIFADSQNLCGLLSRLRRADLHAA